MRDPQIKLGSAAAASKIDVARNFFWTVEQDRLINKLPSVARTAALGDGVYAKAYSDAQSGWVLLWGGEAGLAHIMLHNPAGEVYVYDWIADAISKVGIYPTTTEVDVHPTFNKTCHLGEITQLAHDKSWAETSLNPGYETLGLIHGYEVEVLGVSGALALLFRKEGITAEVSALPERTVPFDWLTELNAAQGELLALPGYPTANVWNLMQGVDAWAISPFTRNVFPYWSWQPAVVYKEPGNGSYVPGFYYGDTEQQGGVLVDNGINELGAPQGFRSLDVTFCAMLDNRKRNSKKPYGYCEMLTRAAAEVPVEGGESRRLLAAFVSELPPETRPNISSFYLSTLNQRYAGTDLTSWVSSFSVDLVEDFPAVPATEDIEVDFWNFYDRTDDEEAMIEDPLFEPRTFDSTAFVAWSGQRAVIYKVPGFYFKLYETNSYHSHSVSSDGSKLAVFECSAEDASVIARVRVFDLYHGFYGEVPRDTTLTVGHYYLMTGSDGQQRQYIVTVAGRTSADPVDYVSETVVQDGTARLEYDSVGVYIANSSVVGIAAGTSACIIPRRPVIARDATAEVQPSDLPYDLASVTPNTTDDSDTYKWRSHLGRVSYGWPVTRNYEWVKIWCSDGRHAKARIIFDECMLGSVMVLRPQTLPPGGTIYTVTITEGGTPVSYTGTFAELKDLLPYVLWSIYSEEEGGFYEVGLCKWAFVESPTLSLNPAEAGITWPVGKSFSVTMTPGSILTPSAALVPTHCRSAREGRTDADGNELEDDAHYEDECTELHLYGPTIADAGVQYSASGGVQPYSWSFTGGTIDETGLITEISDPCGGSYTVTVTDVCGNVKSTAVIVEGPTEGPSISFVGVADVGSVISISGGVSPYSVASPIMTFSQLTESTFEIATLDISGCSGEEAVAEITVSDACSQVGVLEVRYAVPGALWCCASPIPPNSGCYSGTSGNVRFDCNPEGTFGWSGGTECSPVTVINGYAYTSGNTYYVDNIWCRRSFADDLPSCDMYPLSGGNPCNARSSCTPTERVVASCVASRWVLRWTCP